MSKSIYRLTQMQVEVFNCRPANDSEDTGNSVDPSSKSELTIPAQQIYVRTPRIEYGIHFTKDDSLVITGPKGDFMFSTKFVMFQDGTPRLSIDPPPYVLFAQEDDNDASAAEE